MHGGYSTSPRVNDTFVKTSHLMAKVHSALKEKNYVLTSSFQKEGTPGARREHKDVIQRIVQEMNR